MIRKIILAIIGILLMVGSVMIAQYLFKSKNAPKRVEEKVVTIQADQKTFLQFTRGAISKELTDAYHSEEKK